MNKIHVVEFTSGTTAKTITGLFQWNFGQILQIKGLDLPSAVEVHFALRRSEEALRRIGVTKDGVTEVEIPDVLFKTMMTSDYDIYAYVYVSDEEYGSTTHEIVMKVKSRPMPEDIQNNFDELMKAVNALADGKVDKNQGTENNGKFLGVVDGYLVLVDAPSGGSDFPAQPLSSIMTFDSTAYYHINVDDIPDGYTYYYNDCCLDSSNLQLITFKKDGYDDVSNVMYSSDKLPFLISKVQSGALHVTLYSRDGYMNITYSTDGTVTKGDYVQYISRSEVLSKYNTTEYTPTEDYHPTTKKYVDDKAPLIVTFTGTGTEENPWTCNVTYEEIMTAISVGRSVEYYAENLLYNSGIVAIKAQLIPSNDDWYASIILRIIDSNWLIGYDEDNNIFVEKYQKLVSFDDLSNKPFCEYTDYEVLASIACESEESSCEVGADFLEEGKTYHVAINTEEDSDGYDVLCSSYVNATYGLFCNYLGDTNPTGLAKNSEYGFIIYKENASDDIYIILDTDRYTLPCEVVISEPVTKVKTLDEKFIPDTIARIEDIPTEMVMYSEQELTEEQQEQVRANIGAASMTEFSALSQEIDDLILVMTESELKELTQEELAEKYEKGTKILIVKENENLVRSAINPSGEIYNGCGYLSGYRLNSSGGFTESEHAAMTGFIPYTYGKEIHINGGLRIADVGGNCINTYNKNFELISCFYLNAAIVNSGGTSVFDDKNMRHDIIKTSGFTNSTYVNAFNSASYIRVSLNPCIGKDMRVSYI